MWMLERTCPVSRLTRSWRRLLAGPVETDIHSTRRSPQVAEMVMAKLLASLFQTVQAFLLSN